MPRIITQRLKNYIKRKRFHAINISIESLITYNPLVIFTAFTAYLLFKTNNPLVRSIQFYDNIIQNYCQFSCYIF